MKKEVCLLVFEGLEVKLQLDFGGNIITLQEVLEALFLLEGIGSNCLQVLDIVAEKTGERALLQGLDL